MTATQCAEILRLGVAGCAYRVIAARVSAPTMTVYRVWQRSATPAQKIDRQHNQAGFGRWRQRAHLEALIAAARAGEKWKAIGARFYPEQEPGRAAELAWNTFRRQATAADKAARRAALQARNFNQPPGRGMTAARRRIRLGLDNLFSGGCFA